MLAGCGGSSNRTDSTDSSLRFSGKARQVAAVVEDYSRSLGRHDFKRICDVLFTPQNKQAYGGLVAPSSCAGMLAADYGTATNVDFDVTTVERDPNPLGFPGQPGPAMDAFVKVTGTFPKVEPFRGPFVLVLQAGAWRMANG
jgi:hypothetical protein